MKDCKDAKIFQGAARSKPITPFGSRQEIDRVAH
jgi:hypothetical protein